MEHKLKLCLLFAYVKFCFISTLYIIFGFANTNAKLHARQTFFDDKLMRHASFRITTGVLFILVF